jgi:hypothetical protein
MRPIWRGFSATSATTGPGIPGPWGRQRRWSFSIGWWCTAEWPQHPDAGAVRAAVPVPGGVADSAGRFARADPGAGAGPAAGGVHGRRRSGRSWPSSAAASGWSRRSTGREGVGVLGALGREHHKDHTHVLNREARGCGTRWIWPSSRTARNRPPTLQPIEAGDTLRSQLIHKLGITTRRPTNDN